MRILLVPALDVTGGRFASYLPYGLLVLQAIAQEYHTGVDIWRPPDDAGWGQFATTDALCDAVLSLVDLDRYDVVGFSTVTTSFMYAVRMAEQVKRTRPSLTVVFGGPYVTKLSTEILSKFGCIDAVFVGEAEHSFGAFLERCDRGEADLRSIPGVATRDGAVPGITTDDLDDLPLITDAPDYLPWFQLRDGKAGAREPISLEITRGCPLQCSFCSTRQVWGAKVRRKSVTRLLKEMTSLSQICGSTFFNLIGDNVGVPRAPFLEFCDELAEVNPGFTWGCALKLDRLEPEHLRRMWGAGMRAMFVGLESGNQATLDKVRKTTNIEKEVINIRAAVELGFQITTSFIIGFPWEDEQDIRSTYKLHCNLIQSGVDRSQVNILSPIPGTDIVASGKVLFERDWLPVVSDGVASDDEISAVTNAYPNLFTHYGRYETPLLETKSLLSTFRAAKVFHKMFANRPRIEWNRF